jgi:hypothetical protein
MTLYELLWGEVGPLLGHEITGAQRGGVLLARPDLVVME